MTIFDDSTEPSPPSSTRHDDPRPPQGGRTAYGRHGAAGQGQAHGGRGHRSGPQGPERVVALVDGRFWWYLQDEDDSSASQPPQDLAERLQAQMRRHGPVSLTRVLWYCDRSIEHRVPGVHGRLVPPDAQDGGIGLLRGIAQDLQALAKRRGAERVLLVSDDERLLLAVDDAHQRGLAVDMLIDEAAQDLEQLREDEPAWARLLAQADRLVVCGDVELPQRRSPGAGSTRPEGMAPHEGREGHDGHPGRSTFDRPTRSSRGGADDREPPSAAAVELIEREVGSWWGEESPSQREHWRHEVEMSRGIPQELDRQLLLRVSRLMGQALSPAEKAMMRQTVRRTTLDAGPAAPAGPAAAAEPAA